MNQQNLVTHDNVVGLKGYVKSVPEALKNGKGFSVKFRHTVLTRQADSKQPDIWCQLYFIGEIAKQAEKSMVKDAVISIDGKFADLSTWMGQTDEGQMEARALLKIYVNQFEVLRQAEVNDEKNVVDAHAKAANAAAHA